MNNDGLRDMAKIEREIATRIASRALKHPDARQESFNRALWSLANARANYLDGMVAEADNGGIAWS